MVSDDKRLMTSSTHEAAALEEMASAQSPQISALGYPVQVYRNLLCLASVVIGMIMRIFLGELGEPGKVEDENSATLAERDRRILDLVTQLEKARGEADHWKTRHDNARRRLIERNSQTDSDLRDAAFAMERSLEIATHAIVGSE